jgi:hypothetical protein
MTMPGVWGKKSKSRIHEAVVRESQYPLSKPATSRMEHSGPRAVDKTSYLQK